jgi:hypothetical protein
MTRPIPWYVYPLLLAPRRIERNLERIRAAGTVVEAPNLWQLSLGVLRMWHRILVRPETIGMCTTHPVRSTWRARLLQYRPLRFPFLVAERAVAPLDLTGLASPPERLLRHLLGSHHDGNQFVYDLQILSCYPGQLEALARAARTVVESDTPRTRWLRDLTVYEQYHESLYAAVARALADGPTLPPAEADDPDLSFLAYLGWCAAQPPTLTATLAAWRAGRFSLAGGVGAEARPC